MADSVYARVRVGALIAAGLAILCFAILTVGHGAQLFTHTEILQAHFERIEGLETGAPVTLSGVRIGAVDSIMFPPEPENGYVIVKIWVEASAADRVHTDSIMQIHSMGLLGDKFVALTPGSASAPPATPDTVLASINPIDYEAILQREGTDDLIANVMAISGSLRAILGSIENGHGLLSELVRGDDANEPKDRLTLQSIQRTLDHVDKLSVALGTAMDRVNSGQGLVGAMLSDQTNGKQFLDNIEQTTVKLRQTSARLDILIARFDKANGILPQLMENKNFSDDVLPDLRQSSHDLKDILQKINSGKGTAGLMVNNPALYNQLTSFMDNGGGWGIRFINGFYNLTHPLASLSPANISQPVMLTTSQAGACIGQPASATTAVSAIPVVAAPTASVDGLSETK
ncbi:MAG TPA: MlaD family protein [Verrucomicrobiae bacterium]|nr:MlaD family protein [Verrucomicrobiae bacterium]